MYEYIICHHIWFSVDHYMLLAIDVKATITQDDDASSSPVSLLPDSTTLIQYLAYNYRIDKDAQFTGILEVHVLASSIQKCMCMYLS